MAKINILSSRRISALSDGFHADGGSLFVRIRGNSKAWVFRYKKLEKQISIGLGSIHSRSLAEAREMARKMRNAILNGKNPADEVKEKFNRNAATFKEYAAALIESKKPLWRNAKHAQQWGNTLKAYAHPVIGEKLPEEITLSDIKEVLSSLWTTKTETASRVRARVEAVLDYAAVMEESDRRNPARWKGNLDKIFPAPRKISKSVHFASADYRDVPRIMSELRSKSSLSAYCLRFTILTAARSMEARSAFWREIDLDKKTWTLPASRMKAGRQHVVPLNDEAIEILQIMKTYQKNDEELVFAGERGGVISDVAINKTLHSVAPTCSTHGFRSSFRIWGAETTSMPSAVLEFALAHINKDKTEAAYQRSDLFDLRKKLMEAWGFYCAAKNNVNLSL